MNKKNILEIVKQPAYIITFFIILGGLSIIFVSTYRERQKLIATRGEYNIIVDKNKKDILRFEKKNFEISNIKVIKINKIGNDFIYRLEDKKLIADVISEINFDKFVSDETVPEIPFEWNVNVVCNNREIQLMFSSQNKIIKFVYDKKEYHLLINEELHSFMFKLFETLEN